MKTTKNFSWKRVFFVMFVAIVAGVSALSGAIAGGYAVYQATRSSIAQIETDNFTPSTPVINNTQSQLSVSETEVETTVTKAVDKVSPAVVTVIGNISGRVTIFGRTPDQQVSGSGVIISEDGYIITNNHVIANTKQVSVVLADGTELQAVVINTDLYADLAVLKTEGEMPAVASFGNSNTLKPGETVIAIGSALGDFKNSVTVGVVSATGRAIETNQGFQMEDLIQTDAAINQGNSGGPLINLAGEVVGINTLVIRGSGSSSTIAEGLGFAIPSNTARIIAEQIIQKGYFARPYLGIQWQTITPQISRRYGLPVEWGAYVSAIHPNSPAEHGRLEKGDIIVQIGEVNINEDHSFVNALFDHQPEEEVILKIVRGGRQLELTVVLGETQANP